MKNYSIMSFWLGSLLIIVFHAAALEPWMKESVIRGCSHNNKTVCCSVVEKDQPYYTHAFSTDQAHLRSTHLHHSHNEHHCVITRDYLPSPYEQKHMEIAERIDSMSSQSEDARYAVIRSVIFDEYQASIEWLERVRVHMSHDSYQDKTDEAKDLHYLSRFRVTKICHGPEDQIGHVNQTWEEFIEPLTIFARDPRSYIAIASMKRDVTISKNSGGKIPTYPVTDDFIQAKDYVLLQSGESAVLSRHLHKASTTGKYYLFDAGTATFDSSLAWFICGYLQRGISFDEIFAWEYKKVDPYKYWDSVPPKITPYLHFYNKGISPSLQNAHSVLRIIDQRVKEEDFVAFKLDIDTNDIEMRVALDLLRQPHYHKKVDEFFFELHFHCEVVGPCCWDPAVNIPDEFDGFKMTRKSALDYFQQLRYAGIRAHIWP